MRHCFESTEYNNFNTAIEDEDDLEMVAPNAISFKQRRNSDKEGRSRDNIRHLPGFHNRLGLFDMWARRGMSQEGLAKSAFRFLISNCET
jgi:hypothetical protein